MTNLPWIKNVIEKLDNDEWVTIERNQLQELIAYWGSNEVLVTSLSDSPTISVHWK